jgi:phosphoribosylformimino-5-aminoimidazole carboxamide ribonucleotide (ProFAR) isomerase
MLIFPAIDLYGGKAVRLYQGRYEDMTVYSDDPPAVALDFKAKGATHIHIVDLEGAKQGSTPNFDTVCAYSIRIQIAEKWAARSAGNSAEGLDRTVLSVLATDPGAQN